MTVYTAIADSEIDPDSPYTTTLATKMRDNPIAITEGASGAPSIARIARSDPGRLVYISRATLSASASAVFTNLDATYDAYYFMINGLYSSAATGLQINTSINNGSTYAATTYNYYVHYKNVGSAAYTNNIGSGVTTAYLTDGLTSAAVSGFDGDFIMIDNFDSAKGTKINGIGSRGSTGCTSHAERAVAEAVNAVKFFNTGTLTGEIILYGIDSGV